MKTATLLRFQFFAPFVLSLVLAPSRHCAADDSNKELPKWEAGAGFGYLGFEHYPAANQRTDLAFPFPTFQYRGSILRADDREGAKLYLVKRPSWVLQLGGVGFPPLNSANNDARRGMPDLPLLAAPGPQFQKSLSDNLIFKLGVYQAIAARLISAQPAGVIWESDITFRHTFDFRGCSSCLRLDEATSSISLNLIGASQEVHDLYYSVPGEYALRERPSYEAKSGPLQTQISYFQTFKRGGLAFYVGARLSDYRVSANRASPLYKSDHTFAGLVGFTYSLYQSSRTGVPYEETTGVVDKLRKARGE